MSDGVISILDLCSVDNRRTLCRTLTLVKTADRIGLLIVSMITVLHADDANRNDQNRTSVYLLPIVEGDKGSMGRRMGS